MLRSGERQVAEDRAGIRADHLRRYEFAAERLGDGTFRSGKANPCRVLDAGCGVGYGARLLAEAGCVVRALDADEETIEFAARHFDHSRITWIVGDVCRIRIPMQDAAVCFEVLEHLDRPGLALARFPRRLICSVPNQAVIPKGPDNFRHHVRHYTPDAFGCLLEGAGYEVIEKAMQIDASGAPIVGGTWEGGRTMIAVCVR
jgi:SAM-dependent methyltransferase